MLNPITHNRKNLLLYSFMWAAITAAHFFVIRDFSEMSDNFLLLESVIQMSFLYALGIGIWHVALADTNGVTYSAAHWIRIFISGIAIIILWQLMAGGAIWLVLEKDPEYINLFLLALPFRMMFGLLTFIILSITYHNLIVYKNFSEQKIQEERLKNSLAQQELSMLWSQINPHFLFNSLNSISALTLSDPDKAYEMTIMLSDFLRFSINTKEQQMHSIEEELQVCNRYLMIEKIRFGDRISISLHLPPDCASIMVPRLILQPLFENALKHGAYETSKPCAISAEITRNENNLFITLNNSIDPESLQAAKGKGLGIYNTKKRLELIYHQHDLVSTNKTDSNFSVSLHIPLTQKQYA